MAPITIKKLIASQISCLNSIQGAKKRLSERARNAVTVEFLTDRLESLNKMWQEAKERDCELLSRDGIVENAYITDKIFSQIESEYEEIREIAVEICKEKGSSMVASPAIATQAASTRSPREPSTRPYKVPRYELPTFTGKYEEWESFKSMFLTLMHKIPDADGTERLQYLASCLKGPAADIMANMDMRKESYEPTWNALERRYSNPRMILARICESLDALPVSKRDSAASVLSLANECGKISRSIERLGFVVEDFSPWIVYKMVGPLDPTTRKEWEKLLSQRDREIIQRHDVANTIPKASERIPSLLNFISFIETVAQQLSMEEPRQELISSSQATNKRTNPFIKANSATRRAFHVTRGEVCPLCAQDHGIAKCPDFKSKLPKARRDEIVRLRLCFCCFGKHHSRHCRVAIKCNICKKSHNTLLHDSAALYNLGNNKYKWKKTNNNAIAKPIDNQTPVTTTSAQVHTARVRTARSVSILATARVEISNSYGLSTHVRVLLDQGSEVSFISEATVQHLNLPKWRVDIALSGLGDSSAGTAKRATKFRLKSLVHPECNFEVEALVIPKVTGHIPSAQVFEIDLTHFKDMRLADPSFYESAPIDIILGADVYGQLLREGIFRFPESFLVAQDTSLGWVISGRTNASRRAVENSARLISALHCKVNEDLVPMLRRFWEIEEISPMSHGLSADDYRCEEQYQKTVQRNARGRYSVTLPKISNIPLVMEDTRAMAFASLKNLHKRFDRDSSMADKYRNFMTEYEALGHMKRVPLDDVLNSRAWYLPHHPVFKNNSNNSKIRVVFDASRRTRDGHCLNQVLMRGPTLQSELPLILLNWRQYRYAFTADIIKMFRQIDVQAEDQDLQRILWAPSATEEPIDYRLTTVTYGTTCAPYLAIRTLTQLVQDEGERFPMGAMSIKQHTYVDDVFDGAQDIDSAKKKRDDLIALLNTADIRLDKWAVNDPVLLPIQEASCVHKSVKVGESADMVKTLGISWDSRRDQFTFDGTRLAEMNQANTKRSILSAISCLFDPLGWLAPVVVTGKIIMQDIHLAPGDWDDPLTTEIKLRWMQYCTSLRDLSGITIDRWLRLGDKWHSEVHGFSDASARAYAACVYLRVQDPSEKISVLLVAAKTIAPIKTRSIPHLELCGALLLVQLVQQLRKLEWFKELPISLWTDSEIVLAWIGKHACNWKTFIANRVSLIQTELPTAIWRHIGTKNNPADLATRGVSPEELRVSSLWWHGPAFLPNPSAQWPQTKKVVHVNHVGTIINNENEHPILGRFSSLLKLLKVICYCLRPLRRARQTLYNLKPLPTYLTVEELRYAKIAVIKLSQKGSYGAEIQLLSQGRELANQHPLTKLTPFVQESTGRLLVGGRLMNAELSYNAKHPPILNAKSKLSKLMVRWAHRMALHGGFTLTSNCLLQLAWIVGARRLIKKVIRECVICQKTRPRLANQIMGDLPAARVKPSRPFSTSGVDYAGPINLRSSKGRGQRCTKGYIVLFICFSTKAIHLELAIDITTEGFIAAFRRFVSRRGVCTKLVSDNATNFKGANRELTSLFKQASEFYVAASTLMANLGTTWQFIPPSTPHYGGLWEAGIKSVKNHLRRIIGEQTLTFEEMYTVLTEIEACLNSRPLSPLSTDTDSLDALTPAHFLLGETSALVPDAGTCDIALNRLSRFQLMQRLRDNFWKRWSNEYMRHLQEKSKWRKTGDNLNKGQLVLVRDERYPPAKWPLGRIIETHPGADGRVRIVTVRTATSTFNRHVARLCPLHLEQPENNLPDNCILPAQ